MPFEDDDTRKVHTAVIGRADSDWPVFLPYDHDDFDRFMRGRTREDFYCGVLLGGCGKKLTAKRYLDKKCHFAHRPPVHCRRTATGEDSADHLYIGQTVQRWLRRQGYRSIEVTYPDLGSGPGGAVEIRFGPGARLIRVQLARVPHHAWRATRERLADRHTLVHWAYGPDSGLAHNELEAMGHAVRFSLRTVAEHRVVFAGVQGSDHHVEWTELDECRLTDQGIVPPGRTDEPAAEDKGDTVMFPLAPGTIAFTAAADIPPAADGSARRIYTADAQAFGSAAIRARISLPGPCPAPLPHTLYLIEGPARLIPSPDAGDTHAGWLIRAEEISPLPERTDARWPSLRPGSPSAVPASSEPSPAVASGPVMDSASMVAHFRSKLQTAARAGGLVNWETLVRDTGTTPSRITPEERVRLLVAMDYPRATGKPVLSSLVKLAHHPAGPAPFFKDVLTGLGGEPGLSPAEAAAIWESERDTAYALAGSPAVAASSPARIFPPSNLMEADSALVAAFRERLEIVARGQRTIKWETLLKRQGIQPSSFSAEYRVRLLAAVDRPYGLDRPLLSALVEVDGQGVYPLSFFGDVLTELGWKPDARTPTVAAARRAGRERTYALMHPRGRTTRAPGPKAKPKSLSASLFTPRSKARWDDRVAREPGVVKGVRRALVDAARRQVCVGWHTLAAAIDRRPEDLSDAARASILVAVDRPAGPGGVLLSSLVIAPGHSPVPYFDHILERLGRPHDLRPIELGHLRKQEQARAFDEYRS
ncbi:hypothetical protein [Streptomyces aureus]